jgi:moderate conductance mechanosensitive channel
MLFQVDGEPGGEDVDPTVVIEGLGDGCDVRGGFVCERILEWTGSETMADWASFLLDRPLRILFILVITLVVLRLAHRGVRRLTASLAAERPAERFGRAGAVLRPGVKRERAEQRAQTLATVLRSVSSVFIWAVAILLVLGELGVNLAPLIAGAGIVGLALGFGAQTLVRDMISGFFLLLEDQLGVGDIADLGDAVGTVEKVTLRTTTVRSLEGTLWHVPNGEILRVGNLSQNWSRALVDVDVAYGADLAQASAVIQAAADALWEDPEFRPFLVEEPEVMGVEHLAADGVTIRLGVKTEPAAQFKVQRALRARIKGALDDAGLEIPFPQRTVWFRHDDDGPATEQADGAADPTGDAGAPAEHPGQGEEAGTEVPTSDAVDP